MLVAPMALLVADVPHSGECRKRIDMAMSKNEQDRAKLREVMRQ